MTQATAQADSSSDGWSWPIDSTVYDRSSVLTPAEQHELAFLMTRIGGSGQQGGLWPERSYQVLHRLLQPLEDICQVIMESYSPSTNMQRRATTIRAFVIEIGLDPRKWRR